MVEAQHPQPGLARAVEQAGQAVPFRRQRIQAGHAAAATGKSGRKPPSQRPVPDGPARRRATGCICRCKAWSGCPAARGAAASAPGRANRRPSGTVTKHASAPSGMASDSTTSHHGRPANGPSVAASRRCAPGGSAATEAKVSIRTASAQPVPDQADPFVQREVGGLPGGRVRQELGPARLRIPSGGVGAAVTVRPVPSNASNARFMCQALVTT